MFSDGVRRTLVALVALSLLLVAKPTSADGWCRVDRHEASIYVVTQANSTSLPPSSRS